MELMERIRGLIALFPKAPVRTDKDVCELENRVVKRYAQGSVSLSLGKYVTSDDVARLKKKIASYSL